MKRFLLFLGACAAGLVAGFFAADSPHMRDRIGRWLGAGRLVTEVDGVGIYERGRNAEEIREAVVAEKLRNLAGAESVDAAEVDAEMALLQAQFGDQLVFQKAMAAGDLDIDTLRGAATEHLAARQWIEKRIDPQLHVTAEEARAFYDAHPDLFTAPERYRASQLFLAAHDQTPPEAIATKEKMIAAMHDQIRKGRKTLAELAAEFSEDEATRERGGDLGWFSAERMPDEFVERVRTLQPGKVSDPFRTPIGFHIVQLAETKPAGMIPFEQVREMIVVALRNQKRAAAVDRLEAELAGELVEVPLRGE